MYRRRVSQRAKSIALSVGAFALIAIIIWIDLTTGLWNDLVIMAGLAAGLVSFLLSALVLKRIVAKENERRWASVNRLALTELLHSIADEDRSEVSRGVIVPRNLDPVGEDLSTPELLQQLSRLRETTVVERSMLSDALGRWAEFLSVNSSSEQVLLHIADIAMQLERVRDVALEVETAVSAAGSSADVSPINAQVRDCNSAILRLDAELRNQLLAEDRLTR